LRLGQRRAWKQYKFLLCQFRADFFSQPVRWSLTKIGGEARVMFADALSFLLPISFDFRRIGQKARAFCGRSVRFARLSRAKSGKMAKIHGFVGWHGS